MLKGMVLMLGTLLQRPVNDCDDAEKCVMVRVCRKQCNTGDTVPCDMSKPSGRRTSAKNKNNLE